MNRRALFILLAVVAAGTALVVLLQLLPGVRRPGTTTTEPPALPTATPAPEQRVVLLFAGGDGRLHPELRSVPLPAELEARVRTVLAELLAGPREGGRPVVGYPVVVRGVFVDRDHNAYVDLSAPPAPLQGSHTELILTYGVVNTILLNCPELRAVQLLFGGQEVPTLTGHLDLSRPLVLNKRFIAGA